MGSSYRFDLKIAGGLHGAGFSAVDRGEIGQLVLRAVDLFEGSELSSAAWSKMLQRLNAKAGFEVSGFKYEGEAVIPPREAQVSASQRHRRVSAHVEQHEIIYVHNAVLLDECLQHIESISDYERASNARVQMNILEIMLVPKYELIVYEGGGSDDIGTIHIDPILSTWESVKADLKRLTAMEMAFTYDMVPEASHGKAVVCTVANDKQFQDCLKYIYMFEKDFQLDIDVISHATSVSMLPRADAVTRQRRGDATAWTSAVEMYLECSYTSDASNNGPPLEDRQHMVKAGKVAFTSPDTWQVVLGKLNHLEGLPDRLAVVAFSYQKNVDSDMRAVEGEETWEACKTLIMTEQALGGTLAVRLWLREREMKADDEAERGGAVVEGGGEEEKQVAQQHKRDLRREPLHNITLMVYDSDDDPVKMTVRVDISWKELSTRLASMYGEAVSLTYTTDTTTVQIISSESELRECTDAVQKMWILGAGCVLHCAVVSADLGKEHLQARRDAKDAAPPSSAAAAAAALRAAEVAKAQARELTNLHLAAGKSEEARLYSMITGENLKPGDRVVHVNSRDQDGATPLFYASSAGNQRGCEVLLANNANVHALDDYGCTALHSARGGAVSLLIQNGARLNMPDGEGWTPLHRAAAMDDDQGAKVLIDSMADIAATCRMGWTPLHVAARYRSSKVVDLLIGAGAEVLLRTNEGHTAFELAGASPSERHRTAHKDAVSAANARKRGMMSREEGKNVSTLISQLVKVMTDKDGEVFKAGQTMYDVFKRYDMDNDGVLTKAEFHEALAARPFSFKFADREKLHRYIDVDGDDNLDIEEFATALLGLMPPSIDKDIIRVTIESIDMFLPVRSDPSLRAVCLAIDFLGQHREGKHSKTTMVQMGSRSLPIKEGRLAVKHQQRLHIEDDIEKQECLRCRREMLDALDGPDDNLRIEVILYGETHGESESAHVTFKELGSGIATMVPSLIDTNEPREMLRVPIHTKINNAFELPSKWREASSPELQVLFTRVPQSVQGRASIREGQSCVQASQIIDILSDWKKRSKQTLGQQKANIKRASMEPIADVHIEIRALHALDSLVVEAAKKRGFESLSEKWRQRWKLSAPAI